MAPLNPANRRAAAAGASRRRFLNSRWIQTPIHATAVKIGDLMMSAQKGDDQEHAGERRAGHGPLPAEARN